jgi:GNAT superfamily N-acetyltransferase
VIHRSTWAIDSLCYLEDLFVATAERRHGAGRQLLEAVYAHADALGCSGVYWLTQERNAAARGLYDQMARYEGFIQYRRQAASVAPGQ